LDALHKVWYNTVGFNIPFHTLQIISEMIFPANCSTGAKTQLKSKSTKLHHRNLNNNYKKLTGIDETKSNKTKAWFKFL